MNYVQFFRFGFKKLISRFNLENWTLTKLMIEEMIDNILEVILNIKSIIILPPPTKISEMHIKITRNVRLVIISSGRSSPLDHMVLT